MSFKALHNTSEWALEIDSRQSCFHCFFAGVVAKGVHRYVLLALSPLSSMSIIPNVIRAHHFSPSRLSPLCPLSRMLFGLITSRLYVHYPESHSDTLFPATRSHSDTLFPATSLALRFRPQVNPSSACCVVARAIVVGLCCLCC